MGAYIGAAYFFTSSTSFANPAITVGGMPSPTPSPASPPRQSRASSPPRSSEVLAFGLIKGLYPGMTKAEAANIMSRTCVARTTSRPADDDETSTHSLKGPSCTS